MCPCTQPPPSALDDTTKLLAAAILAVITGVIGFVVGQVILYRRTRIALLVGLRIEAITAKEAVTQLLVVAKAKIPSAEAVTEAVAQGKLTFEHLNALPSGFMLYAPTYSVIDTVSKMKRLSAKKTERDIQTVIRYLDRWGTVALVERSYSEAHARLVELSSKIGEESERARIRETADQVKCCLVELVARFEKLLNAAREVEALMPEAARKTKKSN